MPADYDFKSQPNREDADWQTLLSVYTDGEANAEERAQVEALLEATPALRNHLSFMQFASDTFAGAPEVEPPALLRDAIYAATTQRPTLARRLATLWTQTFTPRYGKLTLAGGGLVAASLFAALFWSRSGSVPDAGMRQVQGPLAPAPEKTVSKNVPAQPNSAPSLPLAERKVAKAAPSADNSGSSPAKPQAILASAPRTARAAQGMQLPDKPKVQLVRATSPSKESAKPVAPTVRHTPAPERIEVASAEYSPKPNMGVENLRPAIMREEREDDAFASERVEVKEPEPTPKTNPAVAMNTEASKPENPLVVGKGEPSAESAMRPARRRIYARTTTLPPDPRTALSNAALRRQADNALIGGGRGRTEADQRHTLGFTFVGRF